MRLALCTSFLDGDIWIERILAAAEGKITAIDEYGDAAELLGSSTSYDAVVVALRGVAGLQAVRTLREEGIVLPLLWIADERDYALFSYRYQVTFFLLDTEDQSAMRIALSRLEEMQSLQAEEREGESE